jgi:leucyl-tRNA---protein transferase
MQKEYRMRAALLDDASYPCPYLPGRQACMEQFICENLQADEHEILLVHGYRHFGSYYFRPRCSGCGGCVPVRVPASADNSHRSWRRLLRKTAGLEVRTGVYPPVEEAFALYRQHKRRFADGEHPTLANFRESFFAFHPAARILTVRDGERLVAAAHFDETDASLSAVYTYYDDRDYAWASPGKLAVLKLIREAVVRGRRYLYLGYYIYGNASMAYKAGFSPFEYSPAGGIWIQPDRDLGELRFDPGRSLLTVVVD